MTGNKEKLMKLLDQYRELANDDQEEAHFKADYALLDFIGDPEIETAFRMIPRRYA